MLLTIILYRWNKFLDDWTHGDSIKIQIFFFQILRISLLFHVKSSPILIKNYWSSLSKTKMNDKSSNSSDDNQKMENNWIPAWLPPSTSQMSIITNRISVFYRLKRTNFFCEIIIKQLNCKVSVQKAMKLFHNFFVVFVCIFFAFQILLSYMKKWPVYSPMQTFTLKSNWKWLFHFPWEIHQPEIVFFYFFRCKFCLII